MEADSKGLTLPVWVAAAARAATEALLGRPFTASQSLELPGVEKSLAVPVTSAAVLFGGQQAVAISHCDPGSGLDLTRGLEIWVCVQWQELVAGVEVEDERSPVTRISVEILRVFGVGECHAGGHSWSTPLKPWNSSDEKTEPLSKEYPS